MNLDLRSVYEFFKHYLNSRSKEISFPEDTLADLRSSTKAFNDGPLPSKGSEDGLPISAGDKERFWDSIVTDLPRQVRAKQEVLAESLGDRNSVRSDLIHDRTFPNYRTEV